VSLVPPWLKGFRGYVLGVREPKSCSRTVALSLHHSFSVSLRGLSASVVKDP
jgi:hypothetical protein